MKVQNFAGFMKSRGEVNESGEYIDSNNFGDDRNGHNQYDSNSNDMKFGANPEDENPVDDENGEGEEEEEELTLNSLKAMIEDLTERVEKLEGGEEDEEEAPEGEEDEAPEGEEDEDNKPAE
jgi:hypothetical protein